MAKSVRWFVLCANRNAMSCSNMNVINSHRIEKMLWNKRMLVASWSVLANFHSKIESLGFRNNYAACARVCVPDLIFEQLDRFLHSFLRISCNCKTPNALHFNFLQPPIKYGRCANLWDGRDFSNGHSCIPKWGMAINLRDIMLSIFHAVHWLYSI